jgi:hypothetical protein
MKNINDLINDKLYNNIVWTETGCFTILDLQNLNPKMVPITLRTKILDAISANLIKEVGYIKLPQGRPRKIFAKLPINYKSLKELKNNGAEIFKEFIENTEHNLKNVTCNIISEDVDLVGDTNEIVLENSCC